MPSEVIVIVEVVVKVLVEVIVIVEVHCKKCKMGNG